MASVSPPPPSASCRTTATLFPRHPAPHYAGYTAWRMVVAHPGMPVETAETWGRDARFGIAPLADGRVYCYASANAPAGQRYEDNPAELTRRFGSWHDPIPALVRAAEPGSVLHHDICELVPPIPTYAVGRRSRTWEVARRSRRLGRVAQCSSRPVVAARDALMALAGRLPPTLVTRSLEPVLNWHPPT